MTTTKQVFFKPEQARYFVIRGLDVLDLRPNSLQEMMPLTCSKTRIALGFNVTIDLCKKDLKLAISDYGFVVEYNWRGTQISTILKSDFEKIVGKKWGVTK